MTADEAMAKAALAYLPATYKRAIQLLAETESDANGIAAHLGMTLGSAYKLLMILRDLRVIRIARYVRLTNSGTEIRLWGLGEKNVARPVKLTASERCKAFRERKKVPTIGVWGL
jgi:transcription initiation factor IIE alpha subunit